MKPAKEWVKEYTQSGAFDLVDSCKEAEEIVSAIQTDAIDSQLKKEAASCDLADKRLKSGWHPIEAAPKDGTHILALGDGVDDEFAMGRTPCKRYCVIWWFEYWGEKDEPVGDEGLFRKIRCVALCGWKPHFNEFKFRPTHWMPLPTPPK